LLEVVQLRAMIRADGEQTAAAVVAATIEAFIMVHFFATYTTDVRTIHP
jgi:fluoride ion exporter CrcB/FEX